MDNRPNEEITPLRRQAEILDGKEPFHQRIESLTPEETGTMLHELHVHEIELEIQNEELRRTQLELETSRSKYFDLYDLAPVGYCTINDAGVIVQANIAATILLGLSRTSLINKQFKSFIAKSDQDILYLHHAQLNKTEIPQSFELRLLRADQTLVWVRLDSALVKDLTGNTPVINLAISDISVAKLMEQAVQESEERYKTLVEGSPEPVIVKRNGKIVYMNPSAVSLLGAENPKELQGIPFLDLVHPEYHQTVEKEESTAFLSKNTAQIVHEILIKRDGTPIDVESKSMLITYDGKPSIYSSMRDITELMRLNKVLLEKNIELVKAKAIADKANNAKTNFISGMSHDLRTPLNAILGFAQLIDSGTQPLTPSQKRSIDQILKAGWYLLDLINEILDLSLIESGKPVLSLSSIPLLDVISECGCMVEQQAEKHEIRISIIPPVNTCDALADPMRFRQVVNNLLSNAIKYNIPGGSVLVEWEPVSADTLRISIRDTGEGLTQDQIAELFQPFHRLGNSSKVEQGTGIGLVVCKRLVESMGGTIGIESTVGTGSVFWFELPRADLNQRRSERLTNSLQAHEVQSKRDAYHTVLYIENKPANLLSMCGIIALRSDIRILSARTGESGIEMAKNFIPDVIVTDMVLPDISGIEIQSLLSTSTQTAHIPVIGVGEKISDKEIKLLEQTGFYRYLTIPITILDFFEAVEAVLTVTMNVNILHNSKELL